MAYGVPVLSRRARRHLRDLISLKFDPTSQHWYTQQDLADLIGVSQKTVSRYEKAYRAGMSRAQMLRYGVGEEY